MALEMNENGLERGASCKHDITRLSCSLNKLNMCRNAANGFIMLNHEMKGSYFSSLYSGYADIDPERPKRQLRQVEKSEEAVHNEIKRGVPYPRLRPEFDVRVTTLDYFRGCKYERRPIRESDNVVHKTIESKYRPLTSSLADDDFDLEHEVKRSFEEDLKIFNDMLASLLPTRSFRNNDIEYEFLYRRQSENGIEAAHNKPLRDSLKWNERENVKGSAKYVLTLSKKRQKLKQRNSLKFRLDVEFGKSQTGRNVRNSKHLKRRKSKLNKLQKNESKMYLPGHKKLKEETQRVLERDMDWSDKNSPNQKQMKYDEICTVTQYTELTCPKKWKDQFEKVHEDKQTDATVVNKSRRATEIGQVSLQGGSDGQKGNQRIDMTSKSSEYVHNSTEAEFDSHDPKIEEEIRKLEQLLMCKVCLDKDSCIVFFPCRHMATCESCEIYLQRCPVCRTPIGEAVKINDN